MSESSLSPRLQVACQALLEEWARRGQSPAPLIGAWLDGIWGDVLAAVELRSRSGDSHIPLAELLQAARCLGQQQAAELAA
ncbi:MAG: hypothetical protein EA402_11550 [Planctomycetota bacterium]|nr:MAG: hypothetical protein EA402_11550 [Planctomycetota bacterium]